MGRGKGWGGSKRSKEKVEVKNKKVPTNLHQIRIPEFDEKNQRTN